MKIKNLILEFGETFITSLVVILLIYVFIASIEVVWGASMEPNFHTGERILVDKVSKKFKDFERGDIIVFYPPGDDNKHYIKRIVGLPEEIVKIVDCGVYISKDGKKYKLEENYLKENECTLGGIKIQEGRSIRLGEGEYLVLGDNRGFSADSRVLGLVNEDRLVGKVIFRFWPVAKIGFIK